MQPKELMEVLYVACNAKSYEERARIAWRASDALWRDWMGAANPIEAMAFARAFNNLCQDMGQEEGWPWVADLWSKAEVAANNGQMAELMTGITTE